MTDFQENKSQERENQEQEKDLTPMIPELKNCIPQNVPEPMKDMLIDLYFVSLSL